MTDLTFDKEDYQEKTCELDGRSVTYLAYEGIVYCSKPVDPVQKLNIFVPKELACGAEMNGYTLDTMPIFMPNTVGGYMAGPAEGPGRDFLGRPNAVFEALLHGYVVVSAGVRGRNSGLLSKEFFVGGKTGNEEQEKPDVAVGKAPALIVDMKAAIRYLRHNKGAVPGNVNRIITSGTSAGGALSAMTGASGNSDDYREYLKAIGAAEERDDIFAANCYCPIHNLEHADAAYEWLFYGCNDFHMMRFEEKDGKVVPLPVEGVMTEKQIRLSAELKQLFPAYVNSLGLVDENGMALTLDKEGHGSFEELVKAYIGKSAQEELECPKQLKLPPMLKAPFSDINHQPGLKIADGKVSSVDLFAYVRTITRMKAAPAFDALNLRSPENEEFGNEEIFAKHFTQFSYKNTEAKGSLAGEAVIKCMNPICYIGEADTAKYWRIRHGSFDRDTSLAIPIILATMLENKGYAVDFKLPWGLPHSGDYDLPELFAWMDQIGNE